jgi:glycosyltransferase involved in cell wall biosynthesis
MNILIIGTTDILGGAAKVSWEIKTELERQGHQVSMFVADKRSDDQKVKIIQRQSWRKYLGFLLATDDLLKSDWILKTEEYKRADIVHFHNIHGRFFNLKTMQKMSREKPVVWTLHDEWAITSHCAYTMEGKEMKNGLYVCPSIDIPPRLLWDNTAYLSWRKNSLYKKSNLHVVVPSMWLMERVQKSTLKDQDVMHIPNGIDTSIFKKTDKDEARAKLGLPANKEIILFLANDAKNNTWKGWKYTEEVIQHFKNDSKKLFLSVGNHITHEDKVDENFAQVKHIGHLDQKDQLALYYSAADALLFTSIAENFPLVILEAMSCGLSIVTFDVGGTKEAVAHKENGFVTEYLNTKGLIDGLDWLFNLDESAQKSISEASVSKVMACYDVHHMTDRYLALYRELYEKHQSKNKRD